MALGRLAPRAFGITCDRCRVSAPMVILSHAEEDELGFNGPLDAIECATSRGFDLTFRIERRHILVTRSLCRACARLFVN